MIDLEVGIAIAITNHLISIAYLCIINTWKNGIVLVACREKRVITARHTHEHADGDRVKYSYVPISVLLHKCVCLCIYYVSVSVYICVLITKYMMTSYHTDFNQPCLDTYISMWCLSRDLCFMCICQHLYYNVNQALLYKTVEIKHKFRVRPNILLIAHDWHGAGIWKLPH